jgi:protein ImuA
MSSAALTALRKTIARIEGSTLDRPQAAGGALSLGCEPVDAQFRGGGLVFGAHEFAGTAGEPLAARAFAFMLIARFLSAHPAAEALHIQEASAAREAGAPYGPGLHALGVDPGRLVLIGAPCGAAALQAGFDALRARAAPLVLLDLWDGSALADLSATRRFNLAAGQAKAFVLMTTSDLSATSAALSRWRIAPTASLVPNRAKGRFLGPPGLDLDLRRNRHGPLGRWTLHWNAHDLVFRTGAGRRAALAPALAPPLSVAA